MSHTPEFRKSSYSTPNSQNCVEVADLTGAAAVRDSQNPEQGHLEFVASEWQAFLAEVKAGRL
ncbi:DUF397 domain-containing protein [Streptomonospora nanhaiensis]|uniref:DUF397 domain-containing protein n=1 Tax=Streptomonospora nanhaiensis TaxID=1323731 RepID=UPI001C3880E9|nr:DUF397 domain-containing protein [Streptomonospora nanhaiensis]MBV2364977.1 DUF397 domain-containing protein [Streptomonospora nanhaiensis]MBX9389809.1 DUF397 domain-containing protein [Streptomonospora nanhaiensis]